MVPKKSRQCELKAPKKPHSPSPPASRTPLGARVQGAPQSFCSPSVGVPHKFSQPEPASPRNLPRKPLLPGSFSESSLPLCCGGLQPPGPASAQGLGHGSRDQEPSARVRWFQAGSQTWSPAPAEASTPGQQPGPLPQPSPHCPQAPGISRASRRAAVADTGGVWMAQIESRAGRSTLPGLPVFPHPISVSLQPCPDLLLLASTSSHSEHGESGSTGMGHGAETSSLMSGIPAGTQTRCTMDVEPIPLWTRPQEQR